ncbi:MAG: fused MFS/spermidine synthase [Planctomycetota bacterium]|nr:fused MFS/spermidine synthase [Planctomycetota bacterium]
MAPEDTRATMLKAGPQSARPGTTEAAVPHTVPTAPVASPPAVSAPVAPVAVPGVWQTTLLFCVTVFTSAFLLFQVQPVIGKCILPWFGSSPGVWATCMLFFQLLLLGGYAYAHFIVSRLPSRRQALVHGTLLLLALLTLPIAPDPSWKPVDADAPVGRILWVLSASVGLPYLLLSATGPLLQGWFARLQPGRSPYRLYALSNAGSLLALLSYPFVFERILRLPQQTGLWSWGYGVFALLCCLCGWMLLKRAPAQAPRPVDTAGVGRSDASRPRLGQIVMWLALSACGSGLLLATTNQMCLDVAVVPFLWIVPLCLYLLTFILCFDSDRWYVRPLYFALLPIVAINAVRILHGGVHMGLVEQIVGYSLALFVCCMCAHGELARLKPAPRQLTFFFLMVSIGGALGGLFVAIVAPAVLAGFYEYHILFTSCAVLMAWVALRSRPVEATSQLRTVLRGLCAVVGLAALLAGVGLAFDATAWFEGSASSRTQALWETWRGQMAVAVSLVAAMVLLGIEMRRRLGGHGLREWWASPRRLRILFVRMTVVVGVVVFAGSLLWIVREDERKHVLHDRNFYGMLAIREYRAGRSDHAWGIKHGRIRHGVQLKRHPDWPTSYYGPRSGIGLALRMHPGRSNPTRAFRVGVIGLGAGTMAAYANARVDPERSRRNYVKPRKLHHADVMRFYELNPMVSDWAEEHFTFLRDARARGAKVDTVLGDARIMLEHQLDDGQSQAFDVLAVDAFSSDAVPIHLLTREALDVYWRHLRAGGILAMHVSNRFIDMKPVVHRLAKDLGHELLYIKNKKRESRRVDSSGWLLMTSNTVFLAQDAVHEHARDLPEPGPRWTDDFSSLFDLLKSD